ncbi:MAG: hypothetical protein KGJ90_06425 [Patescibacteria group bacterium]|nr:hypothetical protein [Patescibacteria group bacterium]
MEQIKLEVKNFYGTYRYIPMDKLSAAIATIAGRKTLLMDDIKLLNNVGLTVILVDSKSKRETILASGYFNNKIAIESEREL